MNQKIMDVIGIIGVGSLGYGIWEIYPPASKIIIGGLLVLFAIYGSRKASE